MEGEGQPLRGVVEPVAQVVGDAVGQPFAVVALPERGRAAHQRDTEDPAGRRKERAGALSLDAQIDGVLQNLRNIQIEQRSKEDGGIGKSRLLPIRAQIADKPPVNVCANCRLFRRFHVAFSTD